MFLVQNYPFGLLSLLCNVLNKFFLLEWRKCNYCPQSKKTWDLVFNWGHWQFLKTGDLWCLIFPHLLLKTELSLFKDKHTHIYTFHSVFYQVIQVASLSDQTLEVTAEEIQRLEGNENWGFGENNKLTVWLWDPVLLCSQGLWCICL